VHKYFLAPLTGLIWHSRGLFAPLGVKNRPKLGVTPMVRSNLDKIRELS
jgi:hypothetical protein